MSTQRKLHMCASQQNVTLVTGDGNPQEDTHLDRCTRLLVEGGKIRWRFHSIWHSKTPPTVRIFGYLLLKDRLLTKEHLTQRGFPCDMSCVLCDNYQTESALHLLFLCPYATTVWWTLHNTNGTIIMTPQLTPQLIWINAQQMADQNGQHWIKEWMSIFLCGCWNIWKQRNEVIFGGKRMQPGKLAKRMQQDADTWIKYC